MIIHDKFLTYIMDIDEGTLTSLDPSTRKPLVTSSFEDLSLISWQWLEENLSDEFWEWVPEQTNWSPYSEEIPKPYVPTYKSAASGFAYYSGSSA